MTGKRHRNLEPSGAGDFVKQSCYHEAGHAVAAYVCGLKICEVDIVVESNADDPQNLSKVVHWVGGDYRLAYQDVFATLGSLAGENLGLRYLVPWYFPAAGRDLVQAATLLITLQARQKAHMEQQVKRLYTGDFKLFESTEPIMEVIHRIHADLVDLFKYEDVFKATLALADAFEGKFRTRECPMSGEYVMSKLTEHIGSRSGSVAAPEWFLAMLKSWGFEAFTRQDVLRLLEVIKNSPCP